MTYRLIHQLQQKAIPVKQACRVLAVSRGGYYQHRQRGESEADTVATARIKAAFAASNRSYGSRRLCRALRAQGTVIGRYRMRRLMQEAALRPVWTRKFTHIYGVRLDIYGVRLPPIFYASPQKVSKVGSVARSTAHAIGFRHRRIARRRSDSYCRLAAVTVTSTNQPGGTSRITCALVRAGTFG